MFIQKCKKCSNQFKWVTVCKSIWNGFKPIECSNCKTKHYVKRIYSIIITICVPLPILFQKFLYGLFGSYSFLFYVIWVATIICLSPFWVRYFVKH